MHYYPLNFWLSPKPHQLPEHVEDFLRQLGKPTVIHVPGKDNTRTRAIVTLLHGNEPSGTKALLHWLRQGKQPAVNLLCIIASVQTALTPPVFSHRYLPQNRDLNRCFNPPYYGCCGQLAYTLLDILKRYQPECIIDIHNTSGQSPDFAITTQNDDTHQAIASLFTPHLTITPLRLGAIMEINDRLSPIVTIECGSPNDPKAEKIVQRGLKAYLHQPNILNQKTPAQKMQLYHHPVRIEIAHETSLTYSQTPHPHTDITLHPDIEQYNFGITPTGTPLGWIKEKNLDILHAINQQRHNIIHQLFVLDKGQLRVRRPLRLSMVTTKLTIAKNDCLFYAVKDDGQPF